VRGSYVSLQSALAHHGLIPEHVPVITSVTTGRPQRRENGFGSFEYHHCRADRLGGYRSIEVAPGQEALVATPARRKPVSNTGSSPTVASRVASFIALICHDWHSTATQRLLGTWT